METKADKSTYSGLFLTALATLAYELVLTRIFSVTVWYHFAFLAVSLAMFGMTTGALAIYCLPALFPQKETDRQMSLFATLLALSAPLAYLMHASMPIVLEPRFIFTAVGFFVVFSNCLVLSIPFMFSGICVCLALTRFPNQVAKLYAADLLGAASACLLVAYELNQADGPTTLLVAAVLAALAGICFSFGKRDSREMKSALLSFVVLGLATSANMMQMRSGQDPFFHLLWIKGAIAPKPIFEKWNSFSAVRVLGDPNHPFYPVGWGLDPARIRGPVTGQLYEDIDSNASTQITGFRGKLEEVDYLRADVTNVAHYLLDNAKVLVIGVGGGRDVLSALVFKQREVLGVELNNHILEALTQAFGGFSGHLDRLPNVRLVNDEARSFVSRSAEKFDMIQISLVDTWAATAAGAFALAENALYTREGWDTFLNHLSDHGILSVSRWYPKNNPGEIYRLLSLASSSLKAHGAANPRLHLALVRFEQKGAPGLSTLIVSRSPLSQAQLTKLQTVCASLNFQIMLSPIADQDKNLVQIAERKLSDDELASHFVTLIAPPTDDCPYFFQMAKAPDMGHLGVWLQFLDDNVSHMQGLCILVFLSFVLSIMLLTCVFLPLKIRAASVRLTDSLPLCFYFMAIGMGFMFIEISQMQRLSIFLGNPSYGLSVVLFTMLAFTGLGSVLCSFLDKRNLIPSATFRMLLICVVIVAVGLLTPYLVKTFMAAETTTRILVAIAALAPLGLVAGIAFPTGMKMAASSSPELTAWLWAINGAASVLSSVLAVLFALNFGISASYYLSCLWYGVAAWAAYTLAKQQLNSAS